MPLRQAVPFPWSCPPPSTRLLKIATGLANSDQIRPALADCPGRTYPTCQSEPSHLYPRHPDPARQVCSRHLSPARLAYSDPIGPRPAASTRLAAPCPAVSHLALPHHHDQPRPVASRSCQALSTSRSVSCDTFHAPSATVTSRMSRSGGAGGPVCAASPRAARPHGSISTA